MTIPILNRDFKKPDDGWYAIETPGEHPNRAADVMQVIDSTAVNSMVREFNGEAAEYTQKTGAPFPGMLIDIEHFKNDLSKETRAYGWLMQLQNRKGALYGQIKWTAIGDAAVEGGEYRFFSTEYDPKDVVILNSASPRRVRPMKLDGLTLTNQPNNPGVPITNRASLDGPPPQTSSKILSSADTLQAAHDDVLAPVATWFKCLKQVRQTALTALGYNHSMSASELFNIARTRYPKEFAAMYGALSNPASTDDSTDVQAAQQQMTDLTNRISQIAGCSLLSAYGFAQSAFPRLVNRLTSQGSRIVNRNPSNLAPKDAAKTAARIINRMISDEQHKTGLPHSFVFSQVMNREPLLAGLASGQISAGKILTEHPGLWERLAMESE